MLWILLSLGSALFIAFVDIISKSVFKKKTLSPLQLNFSSSFFVMSLTLLFFFNKIDFTLTPILLILIFLKVIFLVGFSYLYMSLLNEHDVSKVTPLNNLSPILLLILTAVFLHESVTILNLLGIFIILFATYYLEVIVENHHASNPHKAHKIKFKHFDAKFTFKVFLMLFVISLCAIVDRVLLKTISVYSNLAFTFIFMTLFLIICLAKTSKLLSTLKNMSRNPVLFFLAVFYFVSALLILSALAIPDALTSLIIPLKRTSTLIAAFVGGFLFHERHMRNKLVAIIFMLIGILLIAM